LVLSRHFHASKREIHAAPTIQLQSQRAVLCDVLHLSQFTISDLQLLIRRSELNAVANRKHLLLLALYGEAYLTTWIVCRLLSVGAQNG
jgi:hypothetical protein